MVVGILNGTPKLQHLTMASPLNGIPSAGLGVKMVPEVVRGYRTSHTDILRLDAPAAQVLNALDRCRGDVDATRVVSRPIGELE